MAIIRHGSTYGIVRASAAGLVTAVVCGVLALVGARMALSRQVVEEREVLALEAAYLAQSLQRDVNRFDHAADLVALLYAADLERVFVDAERGELVVAVLSEDADAVRASALIVDGERRLASDAENGDVRAVVDEAARLAARSAVPVRTSVELVDGRPPLVAWGVPLGGAGDGSPVAVYAFAIDLEMAFRDEIESIGTRAGENATVIARGAVTPAEDESVVAAHPVDGLPWTVVVARERTTIVGNRLALYAYALAAVLALSLVAAALDVLWRRTRRERDTERHARELLAQQISSEERFLAAMSHELRTPLNSIIGFSGVLVQGMAGDINEEQRHQLRLIERAGRRMLSLVDDVLDLSRVRAGQMVPEPERFDAGEVARAVLRTLEPSAAEKRLTLVADLPGHPVPMHTDPRLIERILLNLLDNALKFTESGSVTLGVGMQGQCVRFEVVDTGPGIPDGEIPRITDEFYQASRSEASAKPEGTGLGLAISSRLARLLGGAIDIRSSVGAGSVFALVVPPNLSDDRCPSS